jgi:hypothetical protein
MNKLKNALVTITCLMAFIVTATTGMLTFYLTSEKNHPTLENILNQVEAASIWAGVTTREVKVTNYFPSQEELQVHLGATQRWAEADPTSTAAQSHLQHLQSVMKDSRTWGQNPGLYCQAPSATQRAD